MTTEKPGEGANPSGEPQITKEQIEALQASLKQKDDTIKSLQRNLARARTSGEEVVTLKSELQAERESRATVLEVLGKLAAAAELKDVNVQPLIEKLRAKPQEDPKTKERETAGEEIVAIASAAGLSDDAFDEAWKTDSRFAEARALWDAGQFAAAKTAFQVGAVKQKTKSFTEEDVKKTVAEEIAKVRREMAGSSATGGTTGGATGKTMTAAEFAKLPVEERVKLAGDLRAAMRNVRS